MVRLEAKPGREDEVRAFLAGAIEGVNAEAGTPVWLAIEAEPSTFWIVDAHASEEDRQAHLDGAVAAKLMASADELFSEPPAITMTTILSGKPSS